MPTVVALIVSRALAIQVASGRQPREEVAWRSEHGTEYERAGLRVNRLAVCETDDTFVVEGTYL
jgi:hypothetical protein